MNWLLTLILPRLGFSQPKWLAGAVWAALAVLVALFVWWKVAAYGADKYAAGVADTTNRFIELDQKGAENAREIAESIIRDATGADDADIERMLRANGGLRSDPTGDIPAVEQDPANGSQQ